MLRCCASAARQAAVGRARRRSHPDIFQIGFRAPEARSPTRPRSRRKVRRSARCCPHHDRGVSDASAGCRLHVERLILRVETPASLGCSASRRIASSAISRSRNWPFIAALKRNDGLRRAFGRFRPPHRHEYQAADQYFGDMPAGPPVTSTCAGSNIGSAEETTAMSTLRWTWPGASDTGAVCSSLV